MNKKQAIKLIKQIQNQKEITCNYDGSGCYYSGETGDDIMIIKCHGCGCAKVFNENVYSSMETISEQMSKRN